MLFGQKLAHVCFLIAGVAFPFFSLTAEDQNIQTLIVGRENAPNSFDMQGIGSNRATTTVNWNIYDRLVTFGRKQLPTGEWVYDAENPEPMLAKSWEVAEDGVSLIFHLREDALFHDGEKVTAHDVKWSFDRGVSIPGFSFNHLEVAGLESKDQFVVVDDYTFKILLKEKNKFTFPMLTVPVLSIFNSKLAMKHATEEDPWAEDWLRLHDAGSGAFEVESFIQDVQTTYVRNDKWVSGPLPQLKKVIEKVIPSPILRKAMLEMGEIDMAFELPPTTYVELAKTGEFKMIGVPFVNQMVYLDMNVTKVPFNDKRVREAISYAIPYEEIFKKALQNRGLRLFNGENKEAIPTAWPQPYPYRTDLKLAKKLLTEAGYPKGFTTDIYFSLGQVSIHQVIANLVQKELKKIGVNVNIKKVLANRWRTEMGKKEMPMVVGSYFGWINYPDYFFFWNYHGNNNLFNTMSYQDSQMDLLINGAIESQDEKEYESYVEAFITKAFKEVPRIPLFQQSLDLAVKKNVHGYTHWYHAQLDYKPMYKD